MRGIDQLNYFEPEENELKVLGSNSDE